MADLSEILKRRMDDLKVTSAEVAANVGVTQRMVEFYLSGTKNPSYKNLVKLSGLLDFNLAELSEPAVHSNILKSKPNVVIGNTHGLELEALIRIESLLRSQAPYVAEIYAFLAKRPATKVLKDMEQAETAEKLRLLEATKKR